MNDTLSRFVAQQAQLATVHQTYIAQQTALHERFLALQQTAQATLQKLLAQRRKARAPTRTPLPLHLNLHL
ncbi:MAG: hypothetical protein IPH54_04720 [Rhodoferax sp.]|nr:hypothetical protein [Rhodoferax sp.]